MNNKNCISSVFLSRQVTEPTADVELGDVPDADAIVSTDNYSMPYFSPLIFVPPIPFVPGKGSIEVNVEPLNEHLIDRCVSLT